MPDPISWSFALPWYMAALAGGYILGSIPFGVILTRIVGTPDIRTAGSGNIGATNVLRTGNRWLAAGTLLGDMLKGSLAVFIAQRWGPDITVIAAMGAFLGHLFPVWLNFKGGKGISTVIGILLVLYWPVCVFFCVVWLLAAIVTRYSSVASLSAVALTPLFLVAVDYGSYEALLWRMAEFRWQYVELMTFIAVMVFIRHGPNIVRLYQGVETKIGQKDNPPPPEHKKQ
ncbi:MAG: glycerol-3-phosphate 1-O-acyltransferase PlsY [Parvularculales bacterium]